MLYWGDRAGWFTERMSKPLEGLEEWLEDDSLVSCC
jgi:hypothetical protein